MEVKLHHLNASRSMRIVWLLAELGCEHKIIHHKRNEETRLAPSELLKTHPMGKSPLLEDEGVVIAETGAIAEYLLAKYDKNHRLHPEIGSADFPRYLEWIHSAEGAPFLPGLIGFYLQSSGLGGDNPLATAMANENAKAVNHIEAHLSNYDYFAGGSFSAADCLMIFNIQNLESGGALANKPASTAWLKKVRAREGYKKMLEIGV